MKKYLAFKTKDSEGDSWCEKAFLFQSQVKAREFFNPKNKDLLDLFTEEDDRYIHQFKIHDDNPAMKINAVTFTTEYAGDVIIHAQSEGYLIG